jgi:hypothetical protein
LTGSQWLGNNLTATSSFWYLGLWKKYSKMPAITHSTISKEDSQLHIWLTFWSGEGRSSLSWCKYWWSWTGMAC